PMDAWGIDVVVTGSQKCLMLPPGLSFVGVGPRAWEKAAESKGHRYYFDWKQYRRAAKNAESPYTSAVSLMFALDESLAMLEEEGAEARFDRHRLMRDMRSEEHTSELQSRENLVCRLLLEKKKKKCS